MNKKTRNDIAMFLLGAKDIPQNLAPHVHNVAVATNKLKNSLEHYQSQNDLADCVYNRRRAAHAYFIKTKKSWPF